MYFITDFQICQNDLETAKVHAANYSLTSLAFTAKGNVLVVIKVKPF